MRSICVVLDLNKACQSGKVKITCVITTESIIDVVLLSELGTGIQDHTIMWITLCGKRTVFAANWTKATHCVFVYPVEKGKCTLLARY